MACTPVSGPTPRSWLARADIDAIVAGAHSRPADVLGPHGRTVDGEPWLAVRAFRPLDLDVRVNVNGRKHQAVCLDPAGFFECLLPGDGEVANGAYRLDLRGRDGTASTIEDPYRFPTHISDHDFHLWGEGRLYRAWRALGAHPTVQLGVPGVRFAAWAPNAQRMSVMGSFNGWDERTHAMQQTQSGLWELFIPHLVEGEQYKYAVLSRQKAYAIDKMDPFGFHAELRPGTSSRVWSLDRFAWNDQEWLDQRAEQNFRNRPLNIYEVHLGSWARDADTGGWLNYRELGRRLADYCLAMGYTHVQLLPVMEHPLDRSWGYQTTGYFAPTSRFGTPDDFRAMVDHCHRAGIGVILDWVPAHFPKDGHGLAFFDGTHLFEHEDPRQGEHRVWTTRIFNFGRPQVRNFLISNALFWLEEYHIDGFRVDAVAAMLYLDFEREEGDWLPNEFGGRENLEAIAFLKEFNRAVHTQHPGCITIAEESTAWPLVTYPDYLGGLGFDFKWNMGWMHDTLDYFELDPIYRKFNQNLITFGITYAHSENYILAFSHDEVVHLKKSMLSKMPGDAWRRFANLRLLTLYQYCHPGKIHSFMGSEIGQWNEWDEARSIEWDLLAFEPHRQLQRFCGDMGRLYHRLPALWERDSEQDGFQWIEFRDIENTTVCFVRRGENKDDILVVVLNMTPVVRHGYRVGVPEPGPWHEIMNTDQADYGGSGILNTDPLGTEPGIWHDFPQSLALALPPLGGMVLALKPASPTSQSTGARHD
ncbi:MAG: 1,4-alpha-glucan branching protein GlgB [Caldilineaceae bacterium SB0665_bin_21]|nr:1,4-alpha-glucan branching protein GlgB [Caldilineaceae bacterium SB0665_bin_21]MYC63575.1 1,4-alpha-glucan branching protein GlgB [Caldilineaceae bacterium SB0661_bin_34]